MSNKQSTFKSYVDLKTNVSKAAEDVFDQTLEPKLLSGEIVIANAHNVLKFNSFGDLKHGMSGALFCTNFKISFVTAERSSYDLMGIGQKNVLLGENDVPLTCVDAVYQVSSNRKTKQLNPGSNVSGAVKMIQIHCKDFRVYTFSFKFSPRGQDKNVVNAILHHAFPTKLPLLFAFVFNPAKQVSTSNSHTPSVKFNSETKYKVPQFRDAQDWDRELERVSAEGFRVTLANQDFKLSDSLPEYFVVPSCLTDSDLNHAAPQFIGRRVATWSWTHSNGSSLYRMVPLRADTELTDHEERLLRAIKDTHPKKTKSMTINLEKYCPTLSSIQTAFKKLKELCMPESMKDFWSSDDRWYTNLDTTKWLYCVRKCLEVAIQAAQLINDSGNSVILKENEGRDLSCLISSLVQLLLDPYYRTRVGFESLVQREWVVMGHEFLTRYQHVSVIEGEESPVFLLFLDCVWQLVNQFPLSFSFTDTYLITLWDCSHHGLFESFIFNSERQRYRSILTEVKAPAQLVSVWNWSMQFKEEDISLFNNPMYFLRHRQHQNCVGCKNDDLIALQLQSSSPAKENTEGDGVKLPYRKLSQASQMSADQRLSHTVGMDSNLAQYLNASGPAVRFWIQCYLRWVPSVHIVNGGPPSEFLQQCMLVDEIHYLRLKIHSLRTSTPLKKKHNRDSGLYFAFDSPPKLNESFTSAFPFSPNSSSNPVSFFANKSSLSAVAGLFMRSGSTSSYEGILNSSGSMSSRNSDDVDEVGEM